VKLDVVQKVVFSSSGTKTQLGSEFHPGIMGFVYVELTREEIDCAAVTPREVKQKAKAVFILIYLC
jgi:hypothetical protein